MEDITYPTQMTIDLSEFVDLNGR